jgi:hypothetical protein
VLAPAGAAKPATARLDVPVFLVTPTAPVTVPPVDPEAALAWMIAPVAQPETVLIVVFVEVMQM